MAKKRYKKTGFARTKRYPFLNHPAFYKRKGNDDVEYVTFTHSSEVELDDEKVITKELNVNINREDPSEKNRKSRVIPRVYKGKRSSLHKELIGFKLDSSDRTLIENIFSSSKIINIPYTNNSKVNKKKLKK